MCTADLLDVESIWCNAHGSIGRGVCGCFGSHGIVLLRSPLRRMHTRGVGGRDSGAEAWRSVPWISNGLGRRWKLQGLMTFIT